MAEELGLSINEAEFEAAQAHSKEASKAGVKKGTGEVVALDVHDIAALEKNDAVPKTDDSFKFRTSSVLQLIIRTDHNNLRRAREHYCQGCCYLP